MADEAGDGGGAATAAGSGLDPGLLDLLVCPEDELPADLRRRHPAAQGLSPGARVHLRPEAASVFPV